MVSSLTEQEYGLRDPQLWFYYSEGVVVESVAISSDGSYIVAGPDYDVYLWKR